jgi:hypothetical protein
LIFKDVIILEERKLSKKLETNVNKRHQKWELVAQNEIYINI